MVELMGKQEKRKMMINYNCVVDRIDSDNVNDDRLQLCS